MPVGKHPLFRTWCHMRARCFDPKHHRFNYYGARGIQVCAQWSHSFALFVRDMFPSWKPGLSLDRIDNDGHYNRSNCKWSTQAEQRGNAGDTHKVSINGFNGCLSHATRILGIPYKACQYRIYKYGETAQQAIEKVLARNQTK
jgi:hypothetical protein